MIVYLESSALLSWLFDEADGSRVAAALEAAELVAASRLTLVESSRALHRARALRALEEKTILALEHRLRTAAATWLLLELDVETLDRSSQQFPEEPIRTLDALHLATAAILKRSIPDAILVSLDRRVRTNGRALGFRILPEDLEDRPGAR